MKTNQQADYVEKVVAISTSPLNCSNNYYDDKTKSCHPGKRYSLNKLLLKDYLTVGSNQLIFELDAKQYSPNYKIAQKIIQALKELGYPYKIFSSGGKGIHIELWFKSPVLEREDERNLFKEAVGNHLSLKPIRMWLWNKILDLADTPKKIRGVGEIVDSSCILFDDSNNKSKLIRVCGGRKIFVDKITEEKEQYYKTYIPDEEFNKKQIRLKDFNEVRYPTSLEAFTIDKNEFIEFLIDFNKSQSNKHIIPLKKIELKSGYLKLDSVQKILEGLPKGKRSMGAQVLAIAMANDEMSIDDQRAVMTEYVEHCSQAGDEFVLSEAMGWVEWVSSQSEVFWNCEQVKQLKVHDTELCAYCRKNFAKSYKFLTQSTLLEQVEEILDYEIKGEYDTKMLIFLLLLTKDFPSPTGKPGWNIEGDPMSQNVILSSDSSSGKSYITKKILQLFGEKDKDYFVVSRYSKNVLNYYTEENMDGKIIFIEEMQGLDENTSQLRVWMSEGSLTLESVEKVKNEAGEEENRKVKKTTIGQPVFITNQAEGVIGDQLSNRSWVLSTDTSDVQTKHILDYQDDVHLGLTINIEVKKRVVADSLRQLKPYHYIIPFADYKYLNIPTHDVRSRRDYKKFLDLIKSISYLHQRQRPIFKRDGREYLVCDLKDYDYAKKYANNILGATFSGLVINQIDLLNHIRRSSWSAEFEITQLMNDFGKSQPYWYNQLKQLCDLGFIIKTSQERGKSGLYALVETKAANIISLPSSDELRDLYDKNVKKLLENGFEPITTENFSLPKNSVPSEIKVEENISNVIGQEKVIDDKKNNVPIMKSDSCKVEKKTSKLLNLPAQKVGFIIGSGEVQNLKKQALDFIQNHQNHMVEIEEIINSFGEEKRSKVDSLILALKSTGEIIEMKPGKVMIL